MRRRIVIDAPQATIRSNCEGVIVLARLVGDPLRHDEHERDEHQADDGVEDQDAPG